MKFALIAALLAVGGYAVWKHKTTAAAKQTALHTSAVVTGSSDPVGVPLYSQIIAPNRLDQLAAWAQTTADSTVDGSYAPAFGAEENQPSGLSIAL